MFPDACPGTSKYLEVHYACVNNRNPDDSASRARKIPPWMRKQNELSSSRGSRRPVDVGSDYGPAGSGISTTSSTPRKPILVTDKAETTEKAEAKVVTEVVFGKEKVDHDDQENKINNLNSQRVPITTPRSDVENDFSSSMPTTVSTVKQVGNKRRPSPPTPTSHFASTSTLSHAHICPPTTSRQLQWDRTQRGKEAVQPCPIGATGHAKWGCQEDGNWATPTPDMSHCKSVAMANLENQVRKQDPENVLVSALAYLTRTKSLYGGDLETAVSVIRTVANRIQYRLQQSSRTGSFHNKESHIRQVLQNVLRSASNILEASNRQAWLDLSPDAQKKVATELLLGLDENAFLLAGVMNEPDVFLESSDILSKSVPLSYRCGRSAHNKRSDITSQLLLLLSV